MKFEERVPEVKSVVGSAGTRSGGGEAEGLRRLGIEPSGLGPPGACVCAPCGEQRHVLFQQHTTMGLNIDFHMSSE